MTGFCGLLSRSNPSSSGLCSGDQSLLPPWWSWMGASSVLPQTLVLLILYHWIILSIWLTCLPWHLGQQVPQKCLYTSTRLHNITYQKTNLQLQLWTLLVWHKNTDFSYHYMKYNNFKMCSTENKCHSEISERELTHDEETS